jgi:hypothetical protein
VHVDLTVVPEAYLEFAARYPIVLNGRVRDIRKTTTSRYLLRSDGGWEGPVIVKTDLNSGGSPERVYASRWLRRSDRARAVADRLTRRGTITRSGDYRVFDRASDIPHTLLEQAGIVVERFLPDLDDGMYYTHMYLFLGDGERCSRIGCHHAVFKADDNTTAVPVKPHAEARAWREQLGLDYGKIDYTVHDGEVILLDANKTTGSSTYLEPGALRAERRRQAHGLYGYFSGMAPL